MDTVVYKIDNNLYINLTNRCTNSCTFCVRNNKKEYEGYSLWLSKEPTVDEVISNLEKYDLNLINEVVFCGYGEPLLRSDDVILIADYLHKQGKKTRVNTNGQGLLFSGKDLPEKLSGYIDSINISLNATDKVAYQKICKSVYGENAFDSLLEFAKECVKYIPKVYLSVVDIIGKEEIEKARKIVDTIDGAVLRVREYIE